MSSLSGFAPLLFHLTKGYIYLFIYSYSNYYFPVILVENGVFLYFRSVRNAHTVIGDTHTNPLHTRARTYTQPCTNEHNSANQVKPASLPRISTYRTDYEDNITSFSSQLCVALAPGKEQEFGTSESFASEIMKVTK